jgi:ERCC4-related helicase
MISNQQGFSTGDKVRHTRFGTGRIELDKGQTALVRFEHGIEECEKTDLVRILTPIQALELTVWHKPLEVVARIQAEAIQSLNDTWGVFSRSRIALLPHQLWVCRRVIETWPTRWLVADDVGLGKTIEAGLILWALISKDVVRRFLILCPASLVEQWQERLRKMFDIRTAKYVTEADTERADFWGTHNQVVASLQTVRLDRAGRQDRLFESPPWDLLIVDEAHHLNADEKGGPTLGYQIAQRLQEGNRVASIVFFTGTPHRGKNFNFLSLLRLLRPDLFNPQEDLGGQLRNLRQVMIRNNKQNVTDLKGKRLFQSPRVSSETFGYSEEESRFYSMLTEFILTGQAYASSLGASDRRTAILVLITMQKLASSSVAAIRRAIEGRLSRIVQARRELGRLQSYVARYDYAETYADSDELARIEERIVELSSELRLMEDEEPRLRDLLDVANQVVEETKIGKILAMVAEKFNGRKIVFFTEYKATQSLLMSALIQRFGDGCVTFINGDNRADGVIDKSGISKSIVEKRSTAEDRFNSGDVLFLVSTEAAGEGIDLQEQCHTLIHVDLPWNPMRLHQRVGRLNRYGQQKQVEVVSFRNPDTVESRIWDKLNRKIENVMLALREVMEEPEDLFELVLGMTPPSLFREIFSEGGAVPRESLSSWFDRKTARFGDRDVIDTVRDLVGHCAKFDYDQVSPQLPKVDLPHLKPFLLSMLHLNSRRYKEEDAGLSFKTPEVWLDKPGVRRSHENMIFDRKDRSRDAEQRILGVGHKVIDQALRQARSFQVSVTTVPPDSLKRPVIAFEVIDRVTTGGGALKKVIVGVKVSKRGDEKDALLRDWELLSALNALAEIPGLKRSETAMSPPDLTEVKDAIDHCHNLVRESLGYLGLPFKFPNIELSAVIWPGVS